MYPSRVKVAPMESLKLTNYLEALKSKEKTKQKTRLQELVEPFYKELVWNDSTFFQDMTALWVAIRRYMKWRTEAQLLQILQWTKGKDVYPRALIKILSKKP